jgi:hypothetical protein
MGLVLVMLRDALRLIVCGEIDDWRNDAVTLVRVPRVGSKGVKVNVC